MFKKILSKSLVILFLVVIICFLLILSLGHIHGRSTKNSAVQTQQVKKTSKSNGYSLSDSQISNSDRLKENDQPDISVEDTGKAGWLQIVSQGSGKKFTDLSDGNFKIYKAHSPQLLKTATSADSPVMSMSEVVSKYPNSLIMNASGFNMSTGKVTGFQINNGKLFKDWNSDKRAKNAFVFNKDGSVKVYDSSTPASKILQNGTETSFSFGSILIKDGKSLPSDGTVNWEIHSFLGNDKNNNIYLIISDTSTGYQAIMSELQALHLENAIVMDGGGSSQMSLNGQPIYPSQDNRSVNDYIVLK